MRKILALAIFLGASACVSVPKRHGVFIMRYYAQQFSPPPRTLVLDTAPPRHCYVIAQLSAVKAEDAIIRMSEEARLIGADAIILGPEAAKLIEPSAAAVGLSAAAASLANSPIYIPPAPTLQMEVTAIAVRFPESDHVATPSSPPQAAR